MKERMESDILFSQMVKAGKRIYYLDVKQDRRGELYLSITESKRLNGPTPPDGRPVYEKHKVFLYHEDMERFVAAFQAATTFVQEHMGSSVSTLGGLTDYVADGQEPAPDELSGEPQQPVANHDSEERGPVDFEF